MAEKTVTEASIARSIETRARERMRKAISAVQSAINHNFPNLKDEVNLTDLRETVQIGKLFSDSWSRTLCNPIQQAVLNSFIEQEKKELLADFEEVRKLRASRVRAERSKNGPKN